MNNKWKYWILDVLAISIGVAIAFISFNGYMIGYVLSSLVVLMFVNFGFKDADKANGYDKKALMFLITIMFSGSGFVTSLFLANITS